jgi:hypothetical protein
MDTDPSFPRTVFFDGAEIRVDTAEELAALPSGWRDSPTPARHDSLFDPCPLWQGRRVVRVRDKVVVATWELDYHGWKRARGEVFRLEGHLEDPELLTSGAVKPLSDYRSKDRPANTVYRHPPTHRFFVDYETLEAYRLRYKNRYLEDFVPCAFIPQAAATTPATTVEPTSGPPHWQREAISRCTPLCGDSW